jgi:hypothetical protein
MNTPSGLDSFDYDEISREVARLRENMSREDLWRMALFMGEMGRRLQETVAEMPDEQRCQQQPPQSWPKQGDLPWHS